MKKDGEYGNKNLTRNALGGMFWVTASQFVRFLTQLGSILIVSRIIGPENVGIAGFVAPFLSLGILIQDIGISQTIVQSSYLDKRDISSLFWLQTLFSCLIGFLFCLLSIPVSEFYENPEVRVMMFVCAIILVFGGLGTIPMSLANRDMRFRVLAVIEGLSAVTGFAASVAVAFVLRNYWAVLAAPLASSSVSTIAFWLVGNWGPRRPEITGGVFNLIRVGTGFGLFNLSNFFSRNMDNVLIGAYSGPIELGFYDRAYKLLLFPMQQIFLPLAKVMLPTLSKLKLHPEQYVSVFTRAQRLLLLVVTPGVLVLIIFAEWIVVSALGPAWAPVGPIFQWLGIAGLLQPMNSPAGWLFASQGRAADWAKWGGFSAFTTVSGFLLGLPYGPVGVAIVYSVGEIMRTPMLWWFVTKRGPLQTVHVIKNALPTYVALPLCFFLIWPQKTHFLQNGFSGILLATVLIYLSYTVSICAFGSGRGTVTDLWRIQRRIYAKVFRNKKRNSD